MTELHDATFFARFGVKHNPTKVLQNFIFILALQPYSRVDTTNFTTYSSGGYIVLNFMTLSADKGADGTSIIPSTLVSITSQGRFPSIVSNPQSAGIGVGA